MNDDLFNQTSTAKDRGVTRQAVSRSYVTIKNKVYKYMKQNNIEIEEAPHKEVNLYSIAKWYESGVYSAIELSRLFGVSARVIQHYCEKNNIKSPSAERYAIRYTVDDVRREFEKDNYILLTNHYNRQTDKLEYICPEGHKGVTTFHYWRHNNQRCQICHGREYGNGNYNLKSAERNKKEWLDKKAYVYFIKMSGFGEWFYKIGVTVNPTNRFYDFPYDIEILKLYKTNLYFACHIESWLMDILDDYSYEPKKTFWWAYRVFYYKRCGICIFLIKLSVCACILL